MADQETSLRDDLESAIGEVEDGSEETSTNAIEETAAPQAAQETETEVPGEGAAGEPAAAAEPVEAAAPAVQPPVDWAPEVKAKWSELTPDVQSAIAAREAHINETLRDTAEVRQEHDSFMDMIQPYVPLMQAEGATDVHTAVQGLLNTTATLSMGSAEQKAQKIAAMVNHYGIDIELLDRALVGDASAAPQPQAPSDPRIDAIWQRMQAAEQETYRANEAEAAQTIEQFAANPENVHFEAVRDVMADFIDIAVQHGTDMTLEEAYQRACLADPNIAPLVTQNYANQAAGQGQNAVSGARYAAGSLAGKPAVGTSTGLSDDMSLRDTIAAQFGSGDRI